MKRSTRALLAALSSTLLLLICSCSGDKIGVSDPIGVDFTDENIYDIFDYGIVITTDDPTDIVILLSRERVRRCVFELDGREIDTSWEEEEEGWICELHGSQLPGNLDLTAGDSVSYYLAIDGNEFHGVIPIPYQPVVEWQPFDPSRDYMLTWHVAENPRVQVVSLEIEDSSNSGEVSWQFSGGNRDFVIDKENFSGYDPNDLKVRIELYCIGYHLSGECLAFAYQVDRSLWYNHGGQLDPHAASRVPPRETWNWIEFVIRRIMWNCGTLLARTSH